MTPKISPSNLDMVLFIYLVGQGGLGFDPYGHWNFLD